MCEQRKHGSVGAGAGNRPGYPTRAMLAGGRLMIGRSDLGGTAVQLLIPTAPPP